MRDADLFLSLLSFRAIPLHSCHHELIACLSIVKWWHDSCHRPYTVPYVILETFTIMVLSCCSKGLVDQFSMSF